MTIAQILLHIWGLLAWQYVPVPFTGTGGGGATITLINHSFGSGASTASTAGKDTTGANFVAVSIGYNVGVTGLNITDAHTGCASPCNTWTQLTASGGDTNSGDSVIWYSCSASVGANHIVTVAGTSAFVAVNFVAFSNVKATSCFESQTHHVSASAATFQCGSLTPTNSGDLVLNGFQFGTAATVSIDSSYTISDQVPGVGGTNYPNGFAYWVTNSTSPTNPTWTPNASTLGTGACAVFSK